MLDVPGVADRAQVAYSECLFLQHLVTMSLPRAPEVLPTFAQPAEGLGVEGGQTVGED